VRIEVSEFIAKQRLLSLDGLHLVALSGGADSVALLLILKDLGYRIEAAHCNFHLRGEESDRDERFVAELCQAHHTPLHRAHFDTREYAALHKVSIEMAARELRYRYFEQLRQDIGADSICVAHHRDDAVETLLMNLIRGTGIHGLTGIRPKNGYVVRPLLCVSRQEIEQYLAYIGQPFVTDSTNLIDDVLRNQVRLRLVPVLQQILPNSSEQVAKTAAYLQEAEKVLNSAMESQISALVKPCQSKSVGMPEAEYATVSIEALQALPSPELFLYEWLTPYGFSSAQIQQIHSCYDAPSGREFASASNMLLIDRGYLVLASLEKPVSSIRIPEEGNYAFQHQVMFKVTKSDETVISRQADCATLDDAKVSFPLTIRPLQPGDRFHPYGMKGSRLVSDYLTDRKVSLFEKRRQLVITDAQGDIVWLIGHRTDDRFKVTSDTATILRIEVHAKP
jgi:tRNA(Ile)-lysidine synthase